MKVTCQVTSLPVEGESWEIVFYGNNKDWVKGLDKVLSLVDNRLRKGNLTIIEDNRVYVDPETTYTLQEKLGEEKFNHLMQFIDIQFPQVECGNTIYTQEITIVLKKTTAHREALHFRVDMRGSEADKLESVLNDLIKVCDDRLLHMNTRNTESYEYFRTLPMDEQMELQQVIDVLYYRNTADNVVRALHGAQIEAERRLKEQVAEDEGLALPNGPTPEDPLCQYMGGNS